MTPLCDLGPGQHTAVQPAIGGMGPRARRVHAIQSRAAERRRQCVPPYHRPLPLAAPGARGAAAADGQEKEELVLHLSLPLS